MIDVSDDLIRRASAEAVRRGLTLDQWVEIQLSHVLSEEGLAPQTASAFARANRDLWDSPEENAAWAGW